MVVLEIIGAEGKTPRFEKPEGPLIRIGRALDNDVIIDDPYVDAHHAMIELGDEEGWRVRDLGSKNGTIKGRHQVETSALASGDELIVGKTRVRIFSVDHRVEEAQSLHDLEHFLLGFNSMATLVPLLVAMAILPLFEIYFGSGGIEIKPDMFASAAMVGLVVPMVIAAFWSLLARLLRGESRFRVMLNITMMFALLSAVLSPIIQLAFYNFPGVGGATTVRVLISVVMLTIYLHFILVLSTRLKPTINRSVVALIAMLVMASFFVDRYSNRDDFRQFPVYDGAVYTPFVLVRHGSSAQAFQSGLGSVFDDADALA
ncbi:MAG: FHA domain-containing protein, partial [Pseudomonadales bacterium]|nr:FHA domain-containing protein [Pseudomonadales bacterium]